MGSLVALLACGRSASSFGLASDHSAEGKPEVTWSYDALRTVQLQEADARADGWYSMTYDRFVIRFVIREGFKFVSGGNGTTGPAEAALARLAWRKSQRSNASGNCVEMALLPHGSGVAIRNSRSPDGPALVFTQDEITAFVAGVRDGDFDDFVD